MSDAEMIARIRAIVATADGSCAMNKSIVLQLHALLEEVP